MTVHTTTYNFKFLYKNMKSFILLAVLILSFNHSVLTQWSEQVNPSGKKQHGVFFLSSNLGFTCGDTGTVQRSTNAGVTWFSSNVGISGNVNATDIFFASQDTGYCTAGSGSLTGKIYRTSNSGASWTIMFDTTNIGMRDVFFINVNTGWAVGNGGTVKYTSNTGINWVSRNFNGTTNTNVFALSADTVFVSGFGSSGYIVKSVNGGINWSFTTVPANLADIRFIDFVDSYTGYAGGLALGGLGGMCKTTDRGLTWVQLLSYSGTTPTDCAFMNANTGYVVNSTELKLTTDGGTSWSNQTIPSAGQFEKISLVPPFGCIAGKKIATLATIGIQQISSEVPHNFSLSQNYPNPFNPVTNIGFSIPKTGMVKIVVHDILGKQTAVPVDQQLSAGSYTVDFNAVELSSGIYFYSLIIDGITVSTKKMNLVK